MMYDYRFLGTPEALDAVQKGLDYANALSVPRGAQVWELSLHTPDIMASARMCLANLWYYQETGKASYKDAAVRWAITGLPFVYLWEDQSNPSRAEGLDVPVMKYATIAVFGATNWRAPNWIGLPVQWCGLDYAEALFHLAQEDQTLDWGKVAQGILIAAEQMQYPSGPSIGLLPDSFVLSAQSRRIWDINPTVMVMQRRRIQGKIDSIDIVRSPDGAVRVVSPFKTTIQSESEGKTTLCIEAEKGVSYQILINNQPKTILSQGTDKIQVER